MFENRLFSFTSPAFDNPFARAILRVGILFTLVPVANELYRSQQATESIMRQCPPLITSETVSQRSEALVSALPPTRSSAIDFPPTIPPEIQDQIDQLAAQLKEAEAQRRVIIHQTPGLIPDDQADNIKWSGLLTSAIGALAMSTPQKKR